MLAQNARVWELAPDFASLIELPETARDDASPFVPDFVFRLIQLARMPVEQISGTPAGILILRALRAELFHELLSDEVWDEALIERVPREIFEWVLRYILSRGDIDKQAFHHRVKELHSASLQQTAMTLAQQFKHEGREEGQILAHQWNVLQVLEVRFDRVPEGMREAVNQLNDLDRLRELHRVAIRCDSLESFADVL